MNNSMNLAHCDYCEKEWELLRAARMEGANK